MASPRRYNVVLAAKNFAGLALPIVIGGAIAAYSQRHFPHDLLTSLAIGVLLAAPAIAATVAAGLTHLLTKSANASWASSVVAFLSVVLWWWAILEAPPTTDLATD